MSPPVKGETLQKQVWVVFMQLLKPQWALGQLLSSHRTPITFSREYLELWFPEAEHELMFLLGKLGKRSLLQANQIVMMVCANIPSLQENEAGTRWVWVQPGLHTKTLSQNQRQWRWRGSGMEREREAHTLIQWNLYRNDILRIFTIIARTITRVECAVVQGATAKVGKQKHNKASNRSVCPSTTHCLGKNFQNWKCQSVWGDSYYVARGLLCCLYFFQYILETERKIRKAYKCGLVKPRDSSAGSMPIIYMIYYTFVILKFYYQGFHAG